jgi:hypothetical protein
MSTLVASVLESWNDGMMENKNPKRITVAFKIYSI